MALETLEQLSFGLKNRYIATFSKASIGNMVIGTIGSRWRTAGAPGVGALPTTAAACNNDTAGSLVLPPLPTGNNMYIAEVNVSQSVPGQFILFDRLAHMGGLVGNSTGVQDVSLGIAEAAAQGRCDVDGTGVLWTTQGYTNLGSTSTTATFTYTNEIDVSGRTTTVTIPATMRIGSNYPILPNADDKRIKSIQSVALTATTGSAGNWGVTARMRIAELAIPYGMVNFRGDYASIALTELTGNECIEIGMVCGTTSQGQLVGNIAIIRV